jgi:hypothetical protein
VSLAGGVGQWTAGASLLLIAADRSSLGKYKVGLMQVISFKDTVLYKRGFWLSAAATVCTESLFICASQQSSGRASTSGRRGIIGAIFWQYNRLRLI